MGAIGARHRRKERKRASRKQGVIQGIENMAAYLGINPKTMWLWIKEGEFPAAKTPAGMWITTIPLVCLWITSLNRTQMIQTLLNGDIRDGELEHRLALTLGLTTPEYRVLRKINDVSLQEAFVQTACARREQEEAYRLHKVQIQEFDYKESLLERIRKERMEADG